MPPSRTSSARPTGKRSGRFRAGCGARIAGLLSLAVASACSSDEPTGPELPEPPPSFRHQDFYATLQQEAEHLTLVDGDWLEDYGDAAFYGLAYYAHAGAQYGNAGWAARADQAAARAARIIDDADLLNGDINEISMAGLGLIEYIDATGDRSTEATLAELIDRIDALVAAVGWYLETDAVDSFAIDTYGPTSVSGLIGLLNLQYAFVLGGERATAYVEWAQQMQDRIDERAWTGSRYAFGNGREGLFLYPNVAMILHAARLHQLTGEQRYAERALESYAAIQPLRIEAPDGKIRYRSPYSAQIMGAQTDDYTTLSSQNYLMFALQLLYQVTGEARYVAEADSVLDSLESLLFGSWCLSHWHQDPCTPSCSATDVCVVDQCTADACHGGVLHHWMDGGPAVPSDPEYFCSGCNVQLLYLMWYRQHRL